MSEQIIVKSENGKVKKKTKAGFVLGLILSIGGFFGYMGLFSLLDSTVGNDAARAITTPAIGIIAIGVILAVIYGILYFGMSKCTLTVSSSRVYGTAWFGNRVDLPVDSISAVGISSFDSIAVTSASGAIRFWGMENKDELHAAISKLLIDRQNKPVATTTIKQEVPQSNADELQKYKALLDSGTITQDEFDAKKKQLLGL